MSGKGFFSLDAEFDFLLLISPESWSDDDGVMVAVVASPDAAAAAAAATAPFPKVGQSPTFEKSLA